jgi:hypothetical protein
MISKETVGLGFDPRESFNRLSAKIVVNPDNIPHFAYPLAKFISEEKPDYILACDRGARIIGLATHMLYKELYGALPTKDHSISFRRISRKMSPDLIRQQLQGYADRILAETESPKVFVLDDWVFTGRTRLSISEIFADISEGRITMLFGVMMGKGKGIDVSGDRNSFAFWDKRDKGDLIGVDYDYNMTPHRRRSGKAVVYRRKIAGSIKKFVSRIDSGNLT